MHPKQPPFKKDIYDAIVDNVNHLVQFMFFNPQNTTIEALRTKIAGAKLVTLESYSGFTTEELENALPKVTTTFNALIVRLQNKDLTYDEFDAIMAQVKDRSWYTRHK